ncbi:indole-3-glycerol phosphate synthase [Archaeoglobus sulfaticallidus PM70-1]|uniref:indole-3-glycerol-phosphate synthase n=2 Tax=Archaeoglobus TaxID=2233 RepID=N0BCE3_9EURY|nr:indole-3-glycerol phosphate synthase TrpC [Archaeoglobus sulfaticallidus]AGK60663.1 indole-3-glycerol phosphate synthase [Archaeoglobus sulfaticallidus PM70-1]
MDFGLAERIEVYREFVNPVIAEIKTYSPIHGDLVRNRNVIDILRAYENANAVGISYITAREFKGDFENLKLICKETELPVLRKDFILSKEEIERTASAEASAILLIARLLGHKTAEFVDLAHESDLEALVEVHSAEDIQIVEESKAEIIGINNRDIMKLEKDDGDVSVTERLSGLISVKGRIVVSASGIRTLEDLKRALKCADAVLIGTALMMADDPESKLRSFVEG